MVEWSFDVEGNQDDSWLLTWVKHEKSLLYYKNTTLAGSARKSLSVYVLRPNYALTDNASEVISNKNSNQAKHGKTYKKL